MLKCRERLVELEYVVWDGLAETAAAFLGVGNWDCIILPGHELRIERDGDPVPVGDVILKDRSGNLFKMKPLDFAQAYETIKED